MCAYIDLDNKNLCLHQRNLVDGILFVFLVHNFVFVQGSEFGLAAMAEVVAERPETIFIGTANRVAKGVEHVWRYKLTFVGAERMYACMEPPSTTHAGDLMFIMEEVVEGNKWYVAYEGRPVPNAGEARCRLWCFGRTSRRQMMCGAEPPTQKKWKNHSGKRRASWFAHAMRCSCGTLNPFASLDSTAFWRGGPMHWGWSHIQPQSCHGYHFCYVVWGKYKVCRAVFVVKLWMLGFGFDMSERMSEDRS